MVFGRLNLNVMGAVRPSSAGVFFFFFQAEDGIRDLTVTGVQTCALPISGPLDGARRGQGRAPIPLFLDRLRFCNWIARRFGGPQDTMTGGCASFPRADRKSVV